MEKDSILIAHSQEIYLKGLQCGLKNSSYFIRYTADNGIEALKIILESKPKIAILEFDLSFLSAIDIIKTAFRKKMSVQFIVLTRDTSSILTSLLDSLNVIEVHPEHVSFKDLEKSISKKKSKNTVISR